MTDTEIRIAIGTNLTDMFFVFKFASSMCLMKLLFVPTRIEHTTVSVIGVK